MILHTDNMGAKDHADNQSVGGQTSCHMELRISFREIGMKLV